MEKQTALRGMANVSYWADDLKKARDWYSQLFGTEPYFQLPTADNPTYIQFRVGDYEHEIGIIDQKFAPYTPQPGAILYWHVDDIEAALERVLALGATPVEPIIKRGEGFVTASVTDPFGNVIGLMYNVHYLQIFSK